MKTVEKISPYAADGDKREKGEQVRDMFDSIAPAYDVMNRMMTLGVDKSWRRKCVRLVSERHPLHILDLATGTGDLAVAMAKSIPDARIQGADLSEKMLEIGRDKVAKAGLSGRVDFTVADALKLPFENNAFDAVTIAFGVRNFQDLSAGCAEIKRVLRPGGRLVILELSTPKAKFVRPFYNLYTKKIIPLVGKCVSKDKRAYSYLPDSIAAVPARDKMSEILRDVGLKDAQWEGLTFGVATIYTATK